MEVYQYFYPIAFGDIVATLYHHERSNMYALFSFVGYLNLSTNLLYSLIYHTNMG